MKKISIIIILLLFFVIGCNAKEKYEIYLDSFFEGCKYETDYYKFDDITMRFSYIDLNNSGSIITKGIFYTLVDNEIKCYLIIDNEKIYENNNLLFKGIISTQTFYGYKISVIEKNKCVTTAFYTNEGKNVTEGPTFLWNTKNQSFSKYEIDRSQW